MTVAGSYRGKRLFDILVLTIVAIPAIVAGAVCAFVIRLTSPGPVFFRQIRVGLGGATFRIWKFRTMIHAADNPLFPDPDRITPVGRWLRRFSLDELPQLLNVAAGDMSIVGPRPTLPYQVARYDPRQKYRLSVRPGLTGLAQIRGRNAITWEVRIEHDLQYVEHQSVLLDLYIVCQTAMTLMTSNGTEGHPTDDPLARPTPET